MRGRFRALLATSVQAILVVAFIVVVFVAVVAASSRVGSVGGPHLGLSIAATALLAFTFEPARKIAHGLAGRLVYGVTTPPHEVITAFSDRIVRVHAGQEILQEMARMLTETLRAERTIVFLKVGERLDPAATHETATSMQIPSQDPKHIESIEITHEDEVLGSFEIMRVRRFSPDELQLVESLASIASTVVRNLRLRAELQSQVDQLARTSDELTALRRRLVETQDAERRELEHNIHDGAQQYLTALNVQIGLAGMLVRRDPARGRQALAKARDLSSQVIGSIEDLAQGIYPPELAENGVAEALRARSVAMPFRVEIAGSSSRFPPEVEAAAYFTCLEALQNAVKHSRASNVHVRIHEDSDAFSFEVTDDGVGFEPASVESGGLRNMGDRLIALGGSVEITSRPGGGTSVAGRVPA